MLALGFFDLPLEVDAPDLKEMVSDDESWRLRLNEA